MKIKCVQILDWEFQESQCVEFGKLNLPHRLNGIIIARNVIIGKNVTIHQNVTFAEESNSKTTIIEDDVIIGAVILNNAHICKAAKIGANAVVTTDIPGGGELLLVCQHD